MDGNVPPTSLRSQCPAAFDPEVYKVLGEAFKRLGEDPGSLAACVNDLKKQSLAAGHEEVAKKSESSSSARKAKMADKQASMSDSPCLAVRPDYRRRCTNSRSSQRRTRTLSTPRLANGERSMIEQTTRVIRPPALAYRPGNGKE